MNAPDRTEYVYLIGSKDSPIVKIGRSIDVPARLAAIQYMSPLKLTVLWQTEGGAELEAALHRHFKAQRSHGEWFEFPNRDAPEQVARTISKLARRKTRTTTRTTSRTRQGPWQRRGIRKAQRVYWEWEPLEM